MAPDLVLLSNQEFDLKRSVQRKSIFGRRKLQGMHTYDDAFLLSDGGEKCENIFEVKEIIKQIFEK